MKRDELIDGVAIMDFGDPVYVSEDPEFPEECEALGYFDSRTGHVVIDADQPRFGRRIILVHEALHVAEEVLKQTGQIPMRVNHEFIRLASPMVATLLARCRVLDSGPDEVDEFVREYVGVPVDEPEDGRKR